WWRSARDVDWRLLFENSQPDSWARFQLQFGWRCKCEPHHDNGNNRLGIAGKHVDQHRCEQYGRHNWSCQRHLERWWDDLWQRHCYYGDDWVYFSGWDGNRDRVRQHGGADVA